MNIHEGFRQIKETIDVLKRTFTPIDLNQRPTLEAQLKEAGMRTSNATTDRPLTADQTYYYQMEVNMAHKRGWPPADESFYQSLIDDGQPEEAERFLKSWKEQKHKDK